MNKRPLVYTYNIYPSLFNVMPQQCLFQQEFIHHIKDRIIQFRETFTLFKLPTLQFWIIQTKVEYLELALLLSTVLYEDSEPIIQYSAALLWPLQHYHIWLSLDHYFH